MQDNEPCPPGFEPLFRSSPFLETVGPFFYKKEPDGRFIVGLRILPKHATARGGAHGGILLTLVDVALVTAEGRGTARLCKCLSCDQW
jgi:acyl-coenzyme A thioesterase PaaI-like protein